MKKRRRKKIEQIKGQSKITNFFNQVCNEKVKEGDKKRDKEEETNDKEKTNNERGRNDEEDKMDDGEDDDFFSNFSNINDRNNIYDFKYSNIGTSKVITNNYNQTSHVNLQQDTSNHSFTHQMELNVIRTRSKSSRPIPNEQQKRKRSQTDIPETVVPKKKISNSILKTQVPPSPSPSLKPKPTPSPSLSFKPKPTPTQKEMKLSVSTSASTIMTTQNNSTLGILKERFNQLNSILPKIQLGECSQQKLAWVHRNEYPSRAECNIEKVEIQEAEMFSDIEKTNMNRSKLHLEDDEMLRTYKIRIYPTGEQIHLYRNWFGCKRVQYNLGIDYFEKEKLEPGGKMRARIVSKTTADETLTNEKPWLYDEKRCPVVIREEAINQLKNAVGTNRRKKEKNPDHHWKLHKLSKKDPVESIVVSPSGGFGYSIAIHPKLGFKFYPQKQEEWVSASRKKEKKKRELNKLYKILSEQPERVFQRERPPKGQKKSVTYNKGKMKSGYPAETLFYGRQVILKEEKPGYFFLCIPYIIKIKTPTLEVKPNECISLDPGIACFLTGYQMDGTIVEYGKYESGRIFHLGRRLDKLISKYDKMKKEHFIILDYKREKKELKRNKQKRRRLKKAIEKTRQRMKNLKAAAQKEIVKDITDRYKAIIWPRFKVSNMVKKSTRNITKRSVKQMLNWGHYGCKMRAKFKAQEKGCQIYDVGEEYTSRTCTYCAFVKHNLKRKHRKFICPNCHSQVDRDQQAARNIAIKNIDYLKMKIYLKKDLLEA